MGVLTTQEKLQQNRGVINIGDGVEFADITSDGELKVKDNFSEISNKIGSQKHIAVSDVNQMFSQIVNLLQVIVDQNNEAYGLDYQLDGTIGD